MSKETTVNRATPAKSTATPHTGPGSEKTGPDEQISKGAWAHDRIRAGAYALYEQRGREEGRALEDWLNAER
jgi:hypothetical protein